ncbi:hypothetical protein DIPPA_04705 [Diplonema papillatum]|nr:hypothetical protein DIPPA_04705 [Diplonema papillatum]
MQNLYFNSCGDARRLYTGQAVDEGTHQSAGAAAKAAKKRDDRRAPPHALPPIDSTAAPPPGHNRSAVADKYRVRALSRDDEKHHRAPAGASATCTSRPLQADGSSSRSKQTVQLPGDKSRAGKEGGAASSVKRAQPRSQSLQNRANQYALRSLLTSQSTLHDRRCTSSAGPGGDFCISDKSRTGKEGGAASSGKRAQPRSQALQNRANQYALRTLLTSKSTLHDRRCTSSGGADFAYQYSNSPACDGGLPGETPHPVGNPGGVLPAVTFARDASSGQLMDGLGVAKPVFLPSPSLGRPLGCYSDMEPLVMIRARVDIATTRLDLAHCGILDTHLIVLSSIVAAHPTLTEIDLRYNPLTDAAKTLLFRIPERNRKIVQYHLEGTDLTPATANAASALCAANRERLICLETRAERKKIKKALARWQAERDADVAAVAQAEKEARARCREEQACGYRALLVEKQAEHAAIERKLARNAARSRKAAERAELTAAEEATRDQAIEHTERDQRKLLISQAEQCIRCVVLAAHGEEKSALRKLLNADWVDKKRAERARLKSEAAERRALDESEAVHRLALEASHQSDENDLRTAGRASQEHHLALEMARHEKEQALLWKKKQEEQRVELERQLKHERTLREHAKFELEQLRAREREIRSEQKFRAAVDKEDERRRDVLRDVEAVSRKVHRAAEKLMHLERARIALYGETPAVEFSAGSAPTVHWVSDQSSFHPIVANVACSIAVATPPASWADLDKSIADAHGRLLSIDGFGNMWKDAKRGGKSPPSTRRTRSAATSSATSRPVSRKVHRAAEKLMHLERARIALYGETPAVEFGAGLAPTVHWVSDHSLFHPIAANVACSIAVATPPASWADLDKSIADAHGRLLSYVISELTHARQTLRSRFHDWGFVLFPTLDVPIPAVKPPAQSPPKVASGSRPRAQSNLPLDAELIKKMEAAYAAGHTVVSFDPDTLKKSPAPPCQAARESLLKVRGGYITITARAHEPGQASDFADGDRIGVTRWTPARSPPPQQQPPPPRQQRQSAKKSSQNPKNAAAVAAAAAAAAAANSDKSVEKEAAVRRGVREAADEEHTDASVALLVAGSRATTVPVPENCTTENICDFARHLVYRNTAYNPSTHTQRIVTVTIHLDFNVFEPETSPASSFKLHSTFTPSSFVCTPTPFTKPARRTCEASVSLLLSPPILYIPKSLRDVEFAEGTPSDRLALVREVVVTDLPSVTRLSVAPPAWGISQDVGRDKESFAGAELSICFTENYGTEDEILLRRFIEDDMTVVDGKYVSQLTPGSSAPVTASNSAQVAEVVKGCLFQHKEREEKPDGATSCRELALRLTDEAMSRPAFIVKLLKRLRYFNPSQNPSANPRTVEITLTAGSLTPCVARVWVHVLSEDDPTQLVLTEKKLVYRPMGPASIPEHLRQHLTRSELPLFAGAELLDPDTFFVAGGSLQVACLSGLARGDTVFVAETSHIRAVRDESSGRLLLHHTRPRKGDPQGLPYPFAMAHVECSHALKESVRVREDAATDDPGDGKPANLDVRESGKDVGARVRRVEGFRDGGSLHVTLEKCSLEFVQDLLLSIAYTNVFYSSAEGLKRFELTINLGPSLASLPQSPDAEANAAEPVEIDQQLVDFVDVRAAVELFDIGSHWLLDYKEGAGVVRLAPFEVTPEQSGFIESFNDGYILLDVVQGGTVDDILNLKAAKTKDGELVVTLRANAAVDPDDRTLLQLNAQTASSPTSSPTQEPPHGGATADAARSPPGQDASDASAKPAADDNPTLSPPPAAAADGVHLAAPGGDASPGGAERKGSLMDRMRTQARRVASAKIKAREQMFEEAKEGLKLMQKGVDERAGSGKITVSDVTVGGKRIGTLVICPTKLLIRFASKAIGRKDVLTLLRQLTYANQSNAPDVLSKIIRISVKDSLRVPSQVIVAVEVQNVDDVTEIKLHSTRVKYRPNMKRVIDTGCFPVAPLRRAHLCDPDTEFFDGGSITVEIVGGGVKGDCLAFMTPEQQVEARKDSVEFADEMNAVSKVANAVWNAPVWDGVLVANGKQITARPAGGAEFCAGTLDLPRSTTPGCNNLRVKFSANKPNAIDIKLASYVLNCVSFSCATEKLQTGQRTYIIKVQDADNPVEGKLKFIVDVCKPLASLPQQKKPRTGAVGETVMLMDKVTTTIAEGKPQAMLQHGFTQVSLLNGCDEDSISIVPTGQLSIKDGSVQLGVDFLGKITTAPHQLRLEYTWATKTTSKALATLLTSLALKAGSAGVKHTEIVISDGSTDTCLCIEVDIK